MDMEHRRFLWLVCLITLVIISVQSLSLPILTVPVTSSHGGSARLKGESSAARSDSPAGGVHHSDFIRSASLATVEAPNVFSLPIQQQPANQPGYVATEPGIVTQFAMAAQSGTIGLLAHNTLAGSAFFALQPKQRVALLLTNGVLCYYRTSTTEKFQALQPNSVHSNFIDLSRPDLLLSSTDVFQMMYQQVDRLVFQTCIEKDGNPSWGRMFITAMPEEELVDLGLMRPWKNYFTY